MPTDPRPAAPRQRKTYAAPVLKKIALRAEEAVLSNCKTSGSTGVRAGVCSDPTACVSLTS